MQLQPLQAHQGSPSRLPLRTMKPTLIGRDPLDTGPLYSFSAGAALWGHKQRATHFAITGIENALYDIAGKALGVPVYRLLGRSTATRSDSTPTCTPVTKKRPRPTLPKQPRSLVRKATLP